MENQEKKIPMELNDEALKNAVGGNELLIRTLLTPAQEDERCTRCRIPFEKDTMVYSLDGNKLCLPCFEFRYAQWEHSGANAGG